MSDPKTLVEARRQLWATLEIGPERAEELAQMGGPELKRATMWMLVLAGMTGPGTSLDRTAGELWRECRRRGYLGDGDLLP